VAHVWPQHETRVLIRQERQSSTDRPVLLPCESVLKVKPLWGVWWGGDWETEERQWEVSGRVDKTPQREAANSLGSSFINMMILRNKSESSCLNPSICNLKKNNNKSTRRPQELHALPQPSSYPIAPQLWGQLIVTYLAQSHPTSPYTNPLGQCSWEKTGNYSTVSKKILVVNLALRK
jgi:hypothetical protein